MLMKENMSKPPREIGIEYVKTAQSLFNVLSQQKSVFLQVNYNYRYNYRH